MKIQIKFLGGAKSVTGSRYLLEVDHTKILVDCGLFQGLKALRLRNWESFPISPSKIDMVILTHAHIDHSGYLPKLVKEGFNGPIYCTYPTLDLVQILLADSAKLQEEEAAYAQKKGYSRHEKPEPLYTVEDAKKVFPMLVGVEMETETVINENIKFTYYNAGHILGAAILKIKVKGEQQEKKIVFSGDLGRYHDPLLNPPSRLPFADVLLMESTYGNRIPEKRYPEEELGRAIRETYAKGGISLIPAFAVGRTQLILYHLHRLQQKGKIPNIPIYVDSPMAIDVTKLYKHYGHYHRLGPLFEEEGSNPFSFKNLHYYQSQEASMSLNHIRGDAIIISASGMATGGRVLHHLYHRLPNEQDSVIFVGYQAEGTRGRKLLDGDETARMYGIDVPVKASVYYIEGLSAHADQDELMEWAEGFTSKPKITFLIHGEIAASESMAKKINEELEWQTVVPNYLESFVLFDGI
ncbi:metallo-beta-lactamase [Rhodonellum psychrophilum GCM71 = DSM 17998]|uniref:Metallo-beta-lactamase n=2 Tax=Rhodonellum TaxID=336827 RepID=U5BST0_9BACT|nr:MULTISPECIES: MBL fold metallo-hydrolase [Rhodonellum]ERM83660.1 metallo-beta-lactamase [Rhodonellum psychrophilum GCM71 = DSM 17998]SDY91149.1 metallo-beta-lactamase family protein [Rhodonellum ikkaensis]